MTDSWKREKEREKERGRAAQIFTMHVKSKWSLAAEKTDGEEKKWVVHACVQLIDLCFEKREKRANNREEDLDAPPPSSPKLHNQSGGFASYCGAPAVTSCHSIQDRKQSWAQITEVLLSRSSASPPTGSGQEQQL